MTATLSNPKISIIVLTDNKNESPAMIAEQIYRTLEGHDYELIVVDDNSPDETAKVTESLSHRHHIKLIYYKGETGLSSEVIAGFNQAKGEIIGVMEAGLHPVQNIPRLLQAVYEGADIAIASRYIPGGDIKGWSTGQKATLGVLTMFARLVLPSIIG
jgi:dolichol-phosphate mannosyltransferase